MTDASQVVVGTYNVHGWRGLTGSPRPQRIMSVLRALDADVVALQEASCSEDSAGFGCPDLARELDAEVVEGFTMQHTDTRFGNLILTRLPVAGIKRLDLSVPDREPRGALMVDVAAPSGVIRVVTTHLGLDFLERRYQVRNLLEKSWPPPGVPLVLLGDLNEWNPLSRSLEPLDDIFGRRGVKRTFPARLPVFPLDQIRVWPRGALVEAAAVRSREARRASDHLPVRAVIDPSRG